MACSRAWPPLVWPTQTRAQHQLPTIRAPPDDGAGLAMKDLPTALDPRNEHDEARAESAALAAFGRKVDITLDLQRGADQNGVRPGRRRRS